MPISRLYWVVASCALASAVCGCNGASPSAANILPSARSQSGSSPIQHVVIVIQENRTFNDFFASYPGGDGTLVGKAAPNLACSPPITHEKKVHLKMMPLVVSQDMDHQFSAYDAAFDGGKMDGFDRARFGGQNGAPECLYPYQYTDPSQIDPYWTMAKEYTLAEHLFTTQGSDSFTAHQDLIRGGTIVEPGKAIVDLPSCSGPSCVWGCDAPPGTHTSLITKKDDWQDYRGKGPFPCSKYFKLAYPTLRDLLDAKSITWKYYVPPMSKNYGKLMSAFDAVAAVRYGAEWKTNVSTPETTIFNDIKQNRLAAVSWIVPDAPNSDHPGEGTDNGPSWVASIVNAIGESSYWSSSAIVVVWDDWGGLYDNQGMLSGKKYGYGGLGPRVPGIVISPYALAGHISTTQYEFGSILKYVEENWNLGYLGTSDRRANSIIDCFNYEQTPIAFKPIGSRLSAAYFLHEKPSYRPVDTDL